MSRWFTICRTKPGISKSAIHCIPGLIRRKNGKCIGWESPAEPIAGISRPIFPNVPFYIFLSSPETFDGLPPAFCFCFLASFASLVSFYGIDDFVYVDFRHNSTPHSVVSKFFLFRVSALLGAYQYPVVSSPTFVLSAGWEQQRIACSRVSQPPALLAMVNTSARTSPSELRIKQHACPWQHQYPHKP